MKYLAGILAALGAISAAPMLHPPRDGFRGMSWVSLDSNDSRNYALSVVGTLRITHPNAMPRVPILP